MHIHNELQHDEDETYRHGDSHSPSNTSLLASRLEESSKALGGRVWSLLALFPLLRQWNLGKGEAPLPPS